MNPRLVDPQDASTPQDDGEGAPRSDAPIVRAPFIRTPWVFSLLAFVIFLRLGAAGVIDYDEAAYADVSRAMFLSGDLVTPRINGNDFFEKPAFIYWTQVAGFQLFGCNAFGTRIFNAMAAFALALCIYFFSRAPLGRQGATLATLVFSTSLIPMALARVTLTDTWLSLWFVLCLGFFFRASERFHRDGGGKGAFFLACVFSGLAMLTKGAIGFLLPAGAIFLSTLLLRRRFFYLRPSWLFPGITLLFTVGLSWYLLLGFSHESGFAFMGELFWDHHVGRFLGAQQGHSGPIYYYVPVLLVGTLPWSPFVLAGLLKPRAVILAPPQHTTDRHGATDLLPREAAKHLLVIFGMLSALTFIFFSVAATKLPNYVGPMFPGLALLTAHYLNNAKPQKSWRIAGYSSAIFVGSVALFVAALPAVLALLPEILGEKVQKMPGLLEPLALGFVPYLLAAVLLWGAIVMIQHTRQRATARLPFTIAITFAALYAFLWIDMMPRYDTHFAQPLRDAAQLAALEQSKLNTASTLESSDDERIILIGLRHKPSINFYGGVLTHYISRRDSTAITALFAEPQPRIAITTEYYLDRYLRPCAPASGGLDVLQRFTGYVVVRCMPSPG